VALVVIVSLDRSTILAATPHFFVKGKPSPFDVPLENLAREVRSAIGDLCWLAHHPDDLRLLAYAHYTGALNEEELASRLTGSDEDLSADVVEICSLAAPATSDSKIDAAIQSLFWDRAEPWRSAENVAEGWAITVLELVDAIRPNVVPPVLRSDVSHRVVLPWLLAQRPHGAGVGAFTSVLMESSNERDWQVAAALLTDAARDHVLRNELAPSVPKSGTADAQLIVSGLLLTEIFNFGRARHRPLDPDAANRWEHLVEMTRDAVVAATATATAARTLLQSQGNDDTTLLALILGKATNASYRVLTNVGDKLIRQYFRPLVKTEESREQQKLPYLGPLIVNDLVNIWIQIGADEGFFSGLAEGLRCDEYAFEFNYGYYLTDRSRAMILAAIGAVAGAQMKNEHLREAALALADSLRSLPEGVVEPFDEASRADLAKRTGIGLPAK
jgi:hypothetical protein